jgi:hypothetical protein
MRFSDLNHRFFPTILMMLAVIFLLIPVVSWAQNSPPIADAGPDESIFVDEYVVLQGSATDPDNNTIIDWLWTIEATPTGSSPYLSQTDIPDPLFEPDLAGDYFLSLAAFDGLDWSAPDYVTITVAEVLPPEAIAEADVTSGVAPLTVTFDGSQSYDPQGGALSHQWDFGDGSAASTGVSAVHTYDLIGTYDATLTVRDERNQLDTDTIRIKVTDSIPTLSEWGMIIFFVLLVGSASWVVRRKTRQKSV